MNRRQFLLGFLLLAFALPLAMLRGAEPTTRPDARETRVRELVYVLRHSLCFVREDEWSAAIRELIQIGEPAVPDLCAELDRTTREGSTRMIAFALRGIGDPRAVPALIRALPRHDPGSNGIGQELSDPELLRFMTEHSISGRNHSLRGRTPCFILENAVSEINATLRKLTRHNAGNEPRTRGGLVTEKTEREMKAGWADMAVRWETWWSQHNLDFVSEAEVQKLTAAAAWDEEIEAAGVAKFGPVFPTGPAVELGPVRDLVVEPQGTIDAKAFLDLDSGRTLSYMQGFHGAANDIGAWCRQAGVDADVTTLMNAGKTANSLEGADTLVWQVENALWDRLPADIRQQAPLDLRRGPWLHFRPVMDVDPSGHLDALPATFLFTTREHGRGILQVVAQGKTPEEGLHIRWRMFQKAGSPPPAAPATDVLPARGSFGPVIERTLADSLGDGESGLNLDTGRMLAVPAAIRSLAFTEELQDWMVAQHIDLLTRCSAEGPKHDQPGSLDTLMSSRPGNILLQSVRPRAWEEMTPAEVLDLAERPSERNMQSLSPWRGLPAVCVLRTTAGRSGLMEIVEVLDNPKRMKVRYKLVNEVSAAPATQRATTQPAAR